LGLAGFFQPRLQARQHLVARQLLGRVAVAVGQRDVGGFAGLDAERHADDLRQHLVERTGLSVHGHQLGGLDTGSQSSNCAR